MKPIITFLLLLSASALTAQTIYTRTDTIAITQDSATLKAGAFRGLIQWQYSADGQAWENLAGKTTGELKIAGTATGYYRAEITDGTCFPVYSDTAFIGAAADTAEVQAPEVPTPPGDSGFDYTVTDSSNNNAETQLQIGTSGNDKVVQYGGNATTTQWAETSDGNDWILQQGGGNTATQTVSAGEGNNSVYQYTGSGNTEQYISTGSGNQTLVQVGEDSANSMTINTSTSTESSATISQYGGAGSDILNASGTYGNDTISIYGQAGNDTITYTCSAGTDAVTINGGTGTDKLTICEMSGSNITVKDSSGNVLYTSGSGGTTITVSNAESIIVRNAVGDVVYQR